MHVVKAHAYGNDFLYVEAEAIEAERRDPVELARRMCERHTGLGADGLILYRPTAAGARMRLVNADGSHAEVSGNGVRGLAALLARDRGLGAGASALVIQSDSGDRVLSLLEREQGHRFRFRAHMGCAEDIRRVVLDVAGETLEVTALWMGNPQCVVLGTVDEARLHRLGPALQRHSAFPQGVNFEIAQADGADRVRILIWERGVGPTRSSGTGSCAAAVAAAHAGLVTRDVEVVAPGGSQRVEWHDDGVWLTGWAEILFEGRWLA